MYSSNYSNQQNNNYSGYGVNEHVVKIYVWFTYVIPFIGIFLNAVSVAVFLQRRLRKAAVSSFLIAACVCDSMALSFIMYTAYVRTHWWPLTDFGCKFTVYLTAVGRMSSIWLTVCYTAERLLCVRLPFKYPGPINKRHINLVILVVISIMFIEQSFIIVWIHKIPPAFCFTEEPEVRIKYFLVLLILNRLINFILPLLAVAIMNAVIVYTIRKSTNAFGGFQNSTRSRRFSHHKITVMLVLASTINFVLLIPETTSKILEVITEFKTPWVTSFTVLADALSYTSHSFNFLFYVLSGKTFRQDFVDMLCCRKTATRKFTESRQTSRMAFLTNEVMPSYRKRENEPTLPEED